MGSPSQDKSSGCFSGAPPDAAPSLETFEQELVASLAAFDASLALRAETPPPRNLADNEPLSRFPSDVEALLNANKHPGSAPAPATTGASNLLAELRQAADEKVNRGASVAREQKEREERMAAAMKRLYSYLNELICHLDKIRPILPHVLRPLPQVEFSALQWRESFADYRTAGGLETSPIDSFSIRYTLAADGQIVLSRLPNHAPVLQDNLVMLGLRYGFREKRNDRGAVQEVIFGVEREVKVSLLFKGQAEQERVVIRGRNFSTFGPSIYAVPVCDVDDGLLEDFGKYLLGRPNKLLSRLQLL